MRMGLPARACERTVPRPPVCSSGWTGPLLPAELRFTRLSQSLASALRAAPYCAATPTAAQTRRMTYDYDIIICGGGIAGLWLANTLTQAQYNVILIERDRLGAGQTLASQGMIHGGQRYVLKGALTPRATAISRMPERWE